MFGVLGKLAPAKRLEGIFGLAESFAELGYIAGGFAFSSKRLLEETLFALLPVKNGEGGSKRLIGA